MFVPSRLPLLVSVRNNGRIYVCCLKHNQLAFPASGLWYFRQSNTKREMEWIHQVIWLSVYECDTEALIEIGLRASLYLPFFYSLLATLKLFLSHSPFLYVQYISLSFSLSFPLCVWLSLFLSFSLSPFLSLSLSLSFPLCVCVSLSLFVSLSLSLSLFLSLSFSRQPSS